MFPAARYTDPITHDSVTPCGVIIPLPQGPDPTPTMIEGLPAAHIANGVACTGVIAAGIAHPPPPPTPPVPIVLGSPTVFINQMPASRWAPSMDVAGCAVFLGNPALAATRTTLIGNGMGSPRPIKLVKIGNQWVLQFGAATYIAPDASDPNFMGQAAQALQRLQILSPTMRDAFDRVEATGKYVVIHKYSDASDPFNATCTPRNFADAMAAGTSTDDGAGGTITGTGNGTNSDIHYDPAIHGNGPLGTVPDDQQYHSDIWVAHEYIHALHNAEGTNDASLYSPGGTSVHEERNTTGVPAHTYNDTGNATDPNNGTALPATDGLPVTENKVIEDYNDAGVESPVTNEPMTTRPTYDTGGVF